MTLSTIYWGMFNYLNLSCAALFIRDSNWEQKGI